MKAVCGLDVHKDSIYLCILHNDGEIFEKVFGVLTVQLEEMCELLKNIMFQKCQWKVPVSLLDTHLACSFTSFYSSSCQSVFYQTTS